MNYYIDDYIKLYKDVTLAINKAIKDCSLNGKIIFSKNKEYISGFIKLKSNIELHLEKGSILKASSNLSDFNYLDNNEIKVLDIPTFIDCSYNGSPTKFFLYGKDIENIKITGEGTIDGNEEIFYGKQNDHHIDGKFYPRVPLLYLENVKATFFITSKYLEANYNYVMKLLNDNSKPTNNDTLNSSTALAIITTIADGINCDKDLFV